MEWFRKLKLFRANLLSICREFPKWENLISPEIKPILEALCQEGIYKDGKFEIAFKNGKYYAETYDEVIEIESYRDLIDFLKEIDF